MLFVGEDLEYCAALYKAEKPTGKLPKARRASRHIATANAERRGARCKLENEDFARAKPVEAGKPGLSGL